MKVYVVNLDEQTVEELKEGDTPGKFLFRRMLRRTREACIETMKTLLRVTNSRQEVFLTIATLLLFLVEQGELDDAPTEIKNATREYLDRLIASGHVHHMDDDTLSDPDVN